MEDIPFTEQICMMRNKKIIAGFHGAGLTNIIGADPSTMILELFPSHGTNAYEKISRSLTNPYTKFGNEFCNEPSKIQSQLGKLI